MAAGDFSDVAVSEVDEGVGAELEDEAFARRAAESGEQYRD